MANKVVPQASRVPWQIKVFEIEVPIKSDIQEHQYAIQIFNIRLNDSFLRLGNLFLFYLN